MFSSSRLYFSLAPFYVSSLRVLGSGSSSSTPTIRCLKNPSGPCARCADAIQNPLTSKNKRGNPCVLVTATSSDSSSTSSQQEKSFSIFVDMGKTFREALIRAGPQVLSQTPPVKAILLSHFHADAMNSLDDVREFSVDAIPCFCDEVTAAHVRRRDPHLMMKKKRGEEEEEGKEKQKRYVGALDLRSFPLVARPLDQNNLINDNSEKNSVQGQIVRNVDVLGLSVDFVPLFHGRDCTSVGFIFTTKNQKRIAYFSDLGRMCPVLDKEVVEFSKGCDLLFWIALDQTTNSFPVLTSSSKKQSQQRN